MRSVSRRRRYVGGWLLALLSPLFRYSAGRDAYVLRLAGSRVGPVLRRDRRRRTLALQGPDRRRTRAA